MAADHGRGCRGFSGGGVTAPDAITVTQLEAIGTFSQSENQPKPDNAIPSSLLALTDNQVYSLTGSVTTRGNVIGSRGATNADGTPHAQTDQTVPATGFVAFTENQVSPSWTFMQLRAARQNGLGNTDFGVVLATDSWGGQEILAFDVTRTDKFIGANQIYRLNETHRVGAAQGATVTLPYFWLFQGTQAKDTAGAQYRQEFDLVWGQLQAGIAARYPTPPTLLTIVNGGDVNTNDDLYDTPSVQYHLTLDEGGIIATWQRDFLITDRNIHTSTSTQALQGEIAERAAYEVEQGNDWNITYDVVKSGATVTVTFDLRPGETLMEIANLFDDFGGASTCPHFGFEADGGIAAASWAGNAVTLTLNRASATWLRLAHQVQDVSALTNRTGDTMSAHRSTLFGSHTWPSQIVSGAILRRPVPGFRGTFSGDAFVPFSAT